MLVDLRASGFKQEFVGHRDIHFSVLLGHGEFFAVESQQGVFYAVEQCGDFFVLGIDFFLQLVDGRFPFRQLGHFFLQHQGKLVLFRHIGIEGFAVFPDVLSQPGGISFQSGDSFLQSCIFLLKLVQILVQGSFPAKGCQSAVFGEGEFFLRDAGGHGDEQAKGVDDFFHRIRV